MVAEIGLARLSNNDNKDWEVGSDLSAFTSEATALRNPSSCRCCCKTAVLTVAWGVPVGLLVAVVALLLPNALNASLVRVRTLEVQTLSLAVDPYPRKRAAAPDEPVASYGDLEDRQPEAFFDIK